MAFLLFLFLFVMTPNPALQTVSRNLNGRSCPIYPILRVLFDQLADSALLILVQRTIDIAVHLGLPVAAR
jgi:hypothetical protein